MAAFTSYSVLKETTLKPFHPYLYCQEGDEFWNISEININREGQAFLDRWGEAFQSPVIDPELSKSVLENIMATLATYNELPFDRENNPIVATQLPGGHRFNGTIGASVESGVSISIRIKRPFAAQFKDFNVTPEQEAIILNTIAKGGNIMVVGGTSTGKTTFLNILFRHIHLKKRVIIVEDTQELDPPHENQVRHLARRFDTGSGLGYDRKMDTVIRENPDVLGVGELSIFNAFPSFNIMNLGNESFYSTAHANDPLEFLDGFRTRVMLAGYSPTGVIEGLVRRLDLIIQLGRDGHKRVIKDLVQPQDLPWQQLVNNTKGHSHKKRLKRLKIQNARVNLQDFPEDTTFSAANSLRRDEKLYARAKGLPV